MMKTLAELEIEKVLHLDVEEIHFARKKSAILHKTKDIDSAGDELEKTVRKIIGRKLPSSFYTGHGHIVDKHLKSSAQFDIVIVDNHKVPILFQSANETEYFPYESVYAIGEIKSTYYKSKKYIESFIKTIKDTKDGLDRHRIPHPNAALKPDFFNGSYTNPLFSFMIFADSNGFILEDIMDVYKKTEDKYLPNIICFPDKGCLCKFELGESKLGNVFLFPEYLVKEKMPTNAKWCFVPFGQGDTGTYPGANFGFFYFFLLNAVSSIRLSNPELLPYLQKFFNHGEFKFVI